MFHQTKDLGELATRVGKGDAAATASLRRAFEDQLVHIVRRTIRVGNGSSVLAKRILAEAERLAPNGWKSPSSEREWVVDQITQRICASMIDRLQPAPAVAWGARETVCA
jgi:hypothetical protein